MQAHERTRVSRPRAARASARARVRPPLNRERTRTCAAHPSRWRGGAPGGDVSLGGHTALERSKQADRRSRASAQQASPLVRRRDADSPLQGGGSALRAAAFAPAPCLSLPRQRCHRSMNGDGGPRFSNKEIFCYREQTVSCAGGLRQHQRHQRIRYISTVVDSKVLSNSCCSAWVGLVPNKRTAHDSTPGDTIE